MKEAAGEANITVITIVLIGVVAAVGAILIPRVVNNVSAQSCCRENGGTVSGGSCVNWLNQNGKPVELKTLLSDSGHCGK